MDQLDILKEGVVCMTAVVKSLTIETKIAFKILWYIARWVALQRSSTQKYNS